MFKVIALVIIIVAILPLHSQAQVPGDMNCSGSFNGLDITYLVAHFHGGPPGPFMDTTICTWENGDMNGDGLRHTVADWWQILFGYLNIGNHPPLPADQDTISIPTIYSSPGDTLNIPVNIYMAESFTGAFVHISYDSSYIHILDYNENIFMDTLFVSNYFSDIERFQAFILTGTLPHAPGAYNLGELNIVVSENVLPGTDIVLNLVSGNYYPSGFGNYSLPTYFIQPVLVDGIIHVVTTGTDGSELPEAKEINLSNFPNPFNALTTIEYGLPEAGDVKIVIYDLLGHKVETLMNAGAQAGQHQIVWNASKYSSGLYFYRIEAANYVETKRMVLLK